MPPRKAVRTPSRASPMATLKGEPPATARADISNCPGALTNRSIRASPQTRIMMRDPCSSGHASRPFGAPGKAVRTRHDKARSGELCRQPWSILKENIVIPSERREQRQGRTADRAGITPDRAFHHHSVGKALPVHAGPIFVCALDQATAHVERKGPVDDDGFQADH